jgi:hypothetical protein
METRVYINYELQRNKQNQMFNAWLICVLTQFTSNEGIGNGRQDVQHLLVDIWKNLQEWSDEVRYLIYICNMWILWFYFILKINVGVLVY